MIFILLLVTASFRPVVPTVGDLITIDFEQTVTLDPSTKYEIVSHAGKRVVVRTFRPEPFELSGRVGNVSFRKLVVPVTSVLQPDDTMRPAPLKPPSQPAQSNRPLRAIAIASLVAALTWLAAHVFARRAEIRLLPMPEMPAADRFRLSIAELRSDPSRPDRWAALADATRRYLAAIEPGLGDELTTAELLRKVGGTNIRPQDVITTILRQGDLEKFSPWGARPADFDEVADRALDLIPQPEEEVAA